MKTSGKYTAFVMLLFTIGAGFVSCLASASDKGSAPMVLRAEKNTYVFSDAGSDNPGSAEVLNFNGSDTKMLSMAVSELYPRHDLRSTEFYENTTPTHIIKKTVSSFNPKPARRSFYADFMGIRYSSCGFCYYLRKIIICI